MPYGPIARYLETSIGLDLESVGMAKLKSAVAGRMRERGLRDPAEYCLLLSRDPEEQEHVIEEMVVPETWFFRDQGPFDLLAGLCSPGQAGPTPLRILSLPCATGEEPYSIAMALADSGLGPGSFQIDAVDISRRALARARQGLYGQASFRGEPGGWRERYFTPEGRGMRISPELAGAVSFRQGNILGADLPLGQGRRYGIIFCRNLLIYLTREARQRVLERLDSMLEPGGLLFSGHTEVLLFQQFGYALLPERGCFASRKPTPPEPAAEPARVQARRHAQPADKKRKQPPARPRIFAVEKSAGAGDARPELLKEIRELADRGELEKAGSLCAAFIESSGSLHAKAHCLMGEISQARNQAETAERYFLRAVYLDPACYDALVHLSLLYEHEGSPEKALRFRERARRLQGYSP